MLYSQTAQFMQIINMVLRQTGTRQNFYCCEMTLNLNALWLVGSLSGIITTALLLYDQNPSLLGVMAVTTPLTILVTEALDHLTNRWRQAQRETEQYVQTKPLA